MLFAAIDSLMELGADRVLTSGQAVSASEGKEMLTRLAYRSKGKLKILCAGGVRDHNLADLMNMEGISEFHSAALQKKVQPNKDGFSLWQVDEGMVKKNGRLIDVEISFYFRNEYKG